jgi:hypothetical protein
LSVLLGTLLYEISMRQRGDVLALTAVTRGTPLDGDGYTWDGEMRLWDNEILMNLVRRQ